jgi:hypothetical protein
MLNTCLALLLKSLALADGVITMMSVRLATIGIREDAAGDHEGPIKNRTFLARRL